MSAVNADALAPHACAPAAEARRVDLVLLGARGRVGSALRSLLAERQPALRARGLDLRLRAALDRRGLARCDDGLAPDALEPRLQPRRPGDLESLLAHAIAPTLLVDCTASDAVAAGYAGWLAAGVGIVAANKRANAGPLAAYRRLQALSAEAGQPPFRYETTAGAAIPVLAALRALRARGERVRGLQAVLSGSLSYLLARVQDGATVSQALAEAAALGYTEPDPGDDLSCVDVLRKLLVLARDAGFALEQDAVRIEPLLDWPTEPALRDAELARADRDWQVRAEAARAAGTRLVLLAEVDAQGARIGVQALPSAHPLAGCAAGENRILLRTEHQDAVPLLLGGPGAGPTVTAAGVLGDVIEAAQDWCRPSSGPTPR